MNMQQKITVGVVDIAILVELCVSIFVASRDPENLTSIFVKCFFAMLIPTLILAKVIIRKLRTEELEPEA